MGFRASEGFNSFTDGFEVERRSLPALTLGKGEASTAHKARLLLHCGCLEYGQNNLKNWRRQVTAFLSDQGVERNLPHFPLNVDGDLAEFCRGLAEEARAASSEDPLLFPQSFSIPGILHIIFNALEEALCLASEWAAMEKELQAACHLLAEPSSQSLVLEKLYQGAPAEEKAKVEAFKSKLLSWRWQSLQSVVNEWYNLYLSLQERWDPSIFPDSSSKQVEVLTKALQSNWHYLYLSWLCMFTNCVGKEATWFEGCYCHSTILSAAPNCWARRRAMVAASQQENCVWQGRRLTSLALGHGKALCERVQNAGGWQYTAALLICDRSDAQAMAAIDFAAKDKFCQTVGQKLEPFQSLPYLLVGAFGEYCGHTLEEAKSAVKECFAQFEGMQPHQRDSVAALLLETNATVSTQLRDFASRPGRSLHEYADAFMEIRARAFSLCTERHTEGEHARVKFHSRRGFRYAGLVTIAARKRRNEVLCLIKDHLPWLAEQWHSRTVFVTLLEHVLPKFEVLGLSFFEKCNRIYACDSKDHFADLTKSEQEADAYQKTLKKVQLSLEDASTQLNANQMQLVYFMKHFLANGTFVSVPASLWKSATCPSSDKGDCDLIVEPGALEKALLSAKVGTSEALKSHVFFTVVDAHPELKVMVKVRKTRTCPTLVHVSYLPEVVWQGANVAMVNVGARQTMTLDLSSWTSTAFFRVFCQESTVWLASCSELNVQLCPALSVSEVPVLPPDCIMDDEPLEALLLRDAWEERAVEHYQEKREETGLALALKDRPMSHEQQATLMSLFERRAFSEESAASSWDLTFAHRQSLELLQSLGLAKCAVSDFGDECWWLTNACQVSPGMKLRDPDALLVNFYAATGVRHRSKRSCRLAFVLALLQDGWSFQKWKEGCVWHKKGQTKVLCNQVWKRPEMYFKCLLVCDVLFEREGGLHRIHHLAPASYYQDLMCAERMDAFKELTSDQCLKYKAKRKQAKSETNKEEQGPEPLALQMPSEACQLDSVKCKEPSMKEAAVLFDNFTHASGNLRCFTQCIHHASCKKYTFVKNHHSREEAIAWLFAWQQLGAKCKTSEEHKLKEPTNLQVKAMNQAQSLL